MNYNQVIKNLQTCEKFLKEKLKVIIYELLFLLSFSKSKKLFKEVIENQKVLIIGSGSSVKDLKNIPNHVKVLSCKRSPKFLIDNNLGNVVDLYFSKKDVLKQARPGSDNLSKILSALRINLFVTDNLRWGKLFSSNVVWDETRSNYFLKRLIRPLTVNELGENYWRRTSVGVRLLQYAVFFEAKEIYLIGIDLGRGSYFWEKTNPKSKASISKMSGHEPLDSNFIKLMSKKYGNIYSLSKNSPITQFIPFKKI